MWPVVRCFLHRVLPTAVLERSRNTSGKRHCPEASNTTEHTVVHLLLQGGHINAQTLALLSCVSRSFRHACEDDGLWLLACGNLFPSTKDVQAETLIRECGGHKRYLNLLYSSNSAPAAEAAPGVPAAAPLPGSSSSSSLLPCSHRSSPPSAGLRSHHSYLRGLLLLLDVFHQGVPVHSALLDAGSLGGKLLPVDVPHQPDSAVFRLPDAELNLLLQVLPPSSSRRALDACLREFSVTCVALKPEDKSMATLLHGPTESHGIVGSAAYSTFRASFPLPRSCHTHSSLLTVDVILKVRGRLVGVAAPSHRVPPGIPAAGAPAAAAAPVSPPANHVAEETLAADPRPFGMDQAHVEGTPAAATVLAAGPGGQGPRRSEIVLAALGFQIKLEGGDGEEWTRMSAEGSRSREMHWR